MNRKFTLSSLGLGVFLIALGIAYIGDMNFHTGNFATVFRFYPLLPILLGVDYLLNGLSKTEGSIDRPAGWVTTLIILLTIGGLIFSIVPRTMESHFSDMRDFRFTPDHWWSDFGHESTQTFDKTLALPAGITSVRIENDFGKTDIDTGDGRNIEANVEVRYHGPFNQKTPDFIGEVQGQRYLVRVQSDLIRKRRFPRFSVNLTLKLPKGLSVEIASKAGDVEVGSIAGNLDIDVSAGKVEIASVGKNLTARNRMGSIKVDQIRGNADVESSLGEVQLLSCSGAVHARVSTGHLKVNLEKVVEACDFDVSLGSAEIAIPRNAKFSLDAQTSMGSIESRFSVPVEKDAANSKAVGNVNGGGPLIRVKTSTGSIQLQEL